MRERERERERERMEKLIIMVAYKTQEAESI
jgi:hypothetical protein